MKISTLPLRLTAIVAIAFNNCFFSRLVAKAYTFSETTVDQNKVIAIARPYGQGKYDLLVIEQIEGKRNCWKEQGQNPVLIDPLLINFDFTGICRRSTDSNGYSIRLDGNDLGLDYLLRIVNRNGELQLVGTPRSNNYSEIVLGTTQGLASGFMKINLYSGWQFTKRTYQNKVLGHFYLSGSQVAINKGQNNSTQSNFSTASIAKNSSQNNLIDIQGEKYENEISQVVDVGLMSGFKDNTFRPNQSINQGQLISMAVNVINAVQKIGSETTQGSDNSNIMSSENSYQDTSKMKWAYSNFLNTGNTNNVLQTNKSVNRSELINAMQRVVVYLRKELNISKDTQNSNQATSDSSAISSIKQKSKYCNMVTAKNEKEVTSDLEGKATRGYTASVLAKVLDCLKSEIEQNNK